MLSESESAQTDDNVLRDVMDILRHLKQCDATATCEGILVSVPISSKCSDIE